MPEQDLDRLQEQIGHQFADLNLLKQALTHRSYLNENPSHPLGQNERLEFVRAVSPDAGRRDD